jgi:DNA helicase-2/ATP-dependent DNA helicase PcrA
MEGRGAADPEEERRLLYVAMTRARERLFLTRSRRRRLFGRLIDTELSPFVKQIDTKLIERGQPVDTRRRQRQLSLF